MRCIGNPMVKCTPVFMWGHISSFQFNSLHTETDTCEKRERKDENSKIHGHGLLHLAVDAEYIYMYLRFMQNHHAHRKDQLRHFGKET